jgi:hypothetical protein
VPFCQYDLTTNLNKRHTCQLAAPCIHLPLRPRL